LLVFAYIYISQVSVEMHLLCDGIYIIITLWWLYIPSHCANCLRSMTVKKILKIG